MATKRTAKKSPARKPVAKRPAKKVVVRKPAKKVPAKKAVSSKSVVAKGSGAPARPIVKGARLATPKSVVVSVKGNRNAANIGQMSYRTASVIKPSVAMKGACRCPECKAVYYDKHWHSSELVAKEVKGVVLCTSVCETCRNAHDPHGFAGEVIIKGLADAKTRSEIAGLIRNVGNRAMKRDPQERILRIHDDGTTMRVFVSENQLAVSIGKQLDSARKGGRLDITWSKGDKPVHVHWTAPQK